MDSVAQKFRVLTTESPSLKAHTWICTSLPPFSSLEFTVLEDFGSMTSTPQQWLFVSRNFSLALPCSFLSSQSWKPVSKTMVNGRTLNLCFSNLNGSTSSTSSPEKNLALPLVRRRKRYRKQYPGEKIGITEEMRFVAMRLRNVKGKKIAENSLDLSDGTGGEEEEIDGESESESGGGEGVEGWIPGLEGFIKYLVDSQLIFSTVEHIIDESSDVEYSYFRKTGLERSECLSKDLNWFREQGRVIPKPSSPGVAYARYLKGLAETRAPLFLCHFYNIYFAHIAGGQVISRQVSETLLEGRELEFYSWEGNVQELLKGVREKLNMLGEYWTRDEKNKCLTEAKRSFRYLGQIVRLIIL